jgi:cysteinyl-tRNA synthetase
LLTLDDLQARGYRPSTVRYALLSGHYRQTLNFTFDLMRSAQSALQKINAYTQTLLSLSGTNKETFEKHTKDMVLPEKCAFLGDFFEALLDDLNVPKALGCLFTFMHQNPSPSKVQTGVLLGEWCAALYALGIEYEEPDTDMPTVEIPNDIRTLAEQRWTAKQARQFQEADRLRQILAENGWNVLDRKDDYILEPLKGKTSADV